MSELQEKLFAKERHWIAGNPPLAPELLKKNLASLGWDIPDQLRQLYEIHDGGEGSLPSQPWYLQLWPLEFVVETRDSEFFGHDTEFLFFGSNGGGEYFGLDKEGRVFFMDAIAGESSIEIYCKCFDRFVDQIGVEPDEAEIDSHLRDWNQIKKS